jgi:hypothetical protein
MGGGSNPVAYIVETHPRRDGQLMVGRFGMTLLSKMFSKFILESIVTFNTFVRFV